MTDPGSGAGAGPSVATLYEVAGRRVLGAATRRDEAEAELFARIRDGALTVDLLGLRPGE